MDYLDLKLDPDKVYDAFVELEDGSVIAKRSFEVHIPKRFIESGLAEVSDVVDTLAVIGIVIPGECYAPLTAFMNITLAPAGMREFSVKGDKYLVMEFDEGDVFIQNTNVPKDSNIAYYFHMEFIFYAKIPWYVNKDALTSMFDTAGPDIGKPVGSTPMVTRVMNSLQFRDPDNMDNAYRNSKAMIDGRAPIIVGLNNGSMLIDGTFAKLTGGYLRDNMLSAIINPDDKVTDLEMIIKGVPE